MSSPLHLRLGTRSSLLAQWQANWVAGELRRHGISVELVNITTSGDERQTTAAPIAGTGVFTKEIQRELLAGRVDLAVHSLKDLPTDPVPGLILAAVPERAAVADVLVSDRFDSVEMLPPGAVVGTGSLRRRAQLLHHRSDLEMRDIRGNVDTRLRKLREGQFEAIVLAQAGLERLGLAKHIWQVLPPEMMLPAVGQGALGIESREDDTRTREALACLDHAATHAAVVAERAMLAELHGGCLAPIAAWGRINAGQLRLTGRVLDPAGTRKLESELTEAISEAEALGNRVAQTLLEQGAAELIAACRS
jgi:hydroxymethylbilane synthase